MLCVKCGCEAPDAPYCAMCGWQQKKPVQKRTKRGNGLGNVYKRGATWTARVTLYTQAEIVDGKKVLHQHRRTKGGFRTKKDALEYLSTLRSAEGRNAPTMLELYSAWEKNDLPKLSKDKQYAYKKARSRLDDIMGRKIDSLTVAELQSAVNKNSISYYTARDMKVLLSHIYKKALPDEYVKSNLAEYVVLPGFTEKEAVPFSADEVQKMWTAFSEGDKFVGYMLLMIYTGMMPGELFACRKEMIDYERCEIWGCGKKTKKRKEVPIVFPEFIGPVLESLCQLSEKDKLQPQPPDRWYDAYHAATARIGVRDLPPYSCRHTTGTEAAKLNLSAPIIQGIMRHSKITTTQKYIHLGTDETHNAINQFEK